MIIKLRPVLVEKIWGGEKIPHIFQQEKNKKIGEAWIASGIKGKSNLIDENIDLNLNLDKFYLKNKKLFNNYKQDTFPLLIKIIDAKDDLSIQVHPNNKQAKKFENYPYGKNEAWYILDTDPKTEIIVGTNKKIKNKKILENKIKENDFKSIINQFLIKKGDSFNIPSGTLHAIKGGSFIYEVQQPSDITYRLYDYDRKDDSGQKRELHLEKGIKVINLNAKYHTIEKEELNNNKIKIVEIINNKYFNLKKWIINDEVELNFNKNKENFFIATLIKGSGKINDETLSIYDTALITSDELKKIKLDGKMELLVANPK